jgi:hypothetical protein
VLKDLLRLRSHWGELNKGRRRWRRKEESLVFL